MPDSWIVLLPPIAVLVIAVISRNVIASLITGILAASAIATHYSLSKTVWLSICRIWRETHLQSLWCPGETPDHLYTFGFLIFLGIIISLITHTGGIAAYTKTIQSRIHDKKNAQTVSLLLSGCFFIDDYLSSLTVGAIMRPLTDKFSIPRVKLAFLLDTMSAPLCIIIPATSWVAMVLANLETAGVCESKACDIFVDPFNAYLHAIPYMFYPFLTIMSSWFIVRKRISFGTMRQQEQEAEQTGNLFGGKPDLVVSLDNPSAKGGLLDFLLPIGLFLFFALTCILYTGHWTAFGGTNHFLKAMQEANTLQALFIGSFVTLLISIPFFLLQKKITLSAALKTVLQGALLMKNSLLVLLLAWTLGSILKHDLNTGAYLGHLLLGALPPFLLPLMVFITSALITASTGSAWGTISVMVPLTIPLVITYSGHALPLAFADANLLSPVIGALLSGAVAGGHFSPISDSTVLASTSSGSYHLDHVATQIPYLLPALIGSVLALISSSILLPYSHFLALTASFIGSIVVTVAMLAFLNKKSVF